MNSRPWNYLVGSALLLLVALSGHATATTGPIITPPGNGPITPGLPPLAGHAEILLNGGFETAAFSPEWTLNPGGPFDQVCKAGNPIGAATCTVHSGQYAMSFGLAFAQDSLSQSLPTIAGATYVLRFWLANDNPLDQNTETFDVFWDGSDVFSLTSPQPSFPYREVVLHVTASTGSTPLVFVARHDPSQWFLDDVSVTRFFPVTSVSIPTLTELGMVLMALLVAGVAGRQVRRRDR